MAFKEFIVTTPLKHKAKVRMKNLSDDVWDTLPFYANQVQRLGKFKGKDFAVEAATKKAEKSPMRRPLLVRLFARTMGTLTPLAKNLPAPPVMLPA